MVECFLVIFLLQKNPPSYSLFFEIICFIFQEYYLNSSEKDAMIRHEEPVFPNYHQVLVSSIISFIILLILLLGSHLYLSI